VFALQTLQPKLSRRR